MNTLIENVRQWFHDKGIIENSNPLKQLEKTQEELTETRDAAVRLAYAGELHDNYGMYFTEHQIDAIHESIQDGIGDTIVTLIGVCEMYGYTLEGCLQQAYDVISKRKGTMIDGKFVKEGGEA
jgi:hypothetical protein